jgi:hypothetical protein
MDTLSLQQLALQLGIAGLLVLVGYRVAVLFIARWSETEAARTKSLEVGLGRIADHVGDVRESVAALDGKLNAVLSIGRETPAEGLPILRRGTTEGGSR